MTRSVKFEVATIQDAIAKANRIAPTKGAAFEKSAGIVITVDPGGAEQVVVQSTDLEVSFRAVVNCVSTGDEKCTWRAPSSLLTNMLATLKPTAGSQVEFKQFDKDLSLLYILAGKTKAKMHLNVSDTYPFVAAYDPDQLGVVSGLARRLTQVAWATDRGSNSALAGVHIDGEHLMATNKAVAAVVPCKVPVDRPVTAPLTEIASLLRNTSDCAMRAAANHLEVMTDQWTQTRAVLIEAEYPDIKKMLAMFEGKQTGRMTVAAEPFKDALERMLVLVKNDRFPVTMLEFGMDSIEMSMEVPMIGMIIDSVDGSGGDMEPFKMKFTPQAILDAVNASGRPRVTIEYGPTPESPVRVTDDDEFLAMVTPRRLSEGAT